MNRSIGHPVVVVIVIGAPSRKLEKRDRIPSSPWVCLDAVAEGMKGRKEPRSSLNRNFSTHRSFSADVPTLARRIARLRSCSRITDDEERGSDNMSFSIRSRSTSRMRDTVYSAFRVRK
jgi:hypothetical protein